ncbi:MAG: HAD-IB family phosphatase [Methanomassiliicoccales archaeon]|nr:HAD-IB family phosphatase [Methanomassiliicoccales archaeon]
MLCDFDGTITVQDTAEWILDEHAEGDWRALDDDYVQGKISLLECMREQFAMVKAGKALILDELDKNIIIRKGFREMVDLCLKHDAEVVIVSAGLDFVIEHFLARLGVEGKVSTYSAGTFNDDGHIGFKFPALVVPGSRTFKDDLVLQYRRKRFQVAYFGDGMPDAEACALSDHRFAVKGRRLESELARRNLPFVSFEDFHDVIPNLVAILSA